MKNNLSRRRLSAEWLESRHLLAADVFVTEFQASNDNTLNDGNGDSSDWIELFNGGDVAANLLGYRLTDNPADTSKFVLPTQMLAPGEHLVVFASGNNAPDAPGSIHTNFKLSAGGEYVGLYDPSGTLLSEFGVSGADYPQQLKDVSFGLNVVAGEYVRDSQRYFVSPSPGDLNTPFAADLAPIISGIDKPVSPADANTDIVVTATPFAVSSEINTVTLEYRVGYAMPFQVSMTDDGLGSDAVAGDGVYTASIPSSRYSEGEMVRWRVTATAANGLAGQGPTFLDSQKSPKYFGTVVADSTIDTPLPVLQWFTDNISGATGGGTRGSVYYDGEFYDNVFIRRRGQSSNNSPKKNLKFDFNPGDRFLLEPGLKRVDEININNTYYDQADVRQTLASETFASAGVPSPTSFPIHTRLNGNFYSLAIYIEQVDADFLERNGFDPNGALYKVDGGSLAGNNGFNPSLGLDGFLKRTRLNEGNRALRALANAVDENLPQADRAAYLYDNIDIFSVINYLAATSIIHNADHLGKNHYVYQDTEGTGKWSFIPWDLDLTFGKNGANTPSIETYEADITDQGNAAYPNSHPFFGGSEYTRFSNPMLYNRLIDAVFDTPELRDLYLRRLRTVMDEVLQSPGTPIAELKFEARLTELLAQIQVDWDRDDARWVEAAQTNLGNSSDWGEDLPLASHIQRIVDLFLEPRRTHLYDTHNIANAATPGVSFQLVTTLSAPRYIVPVSEINGWQSPTFNDAGWTVGDQGIGFDFGTGYDSLIETDLPTSGGRPKNVYTRTEFDITNQQQLDQITQLFLDNRYDDGFIAYINGVEVARSNGTVGSGITAAPLSHEASSVERFTLNSTAITALNVGSNVLSIQGINTSTNSSDMLLRFSLTGGNGASGDPEIAGIPNEQIGNPAIAFDQADFDANPVSGNQGQEYLRLNNPTNLAVDVSGWRLTGGIDLTFRAGTVIPAGGQLYAVADVKEFLNRNTGPGGGQNLLTHGNYSGQLSFSGETVQLIAADGTLMDTLQIAPTTGNDLQQFLRVTEINFNPETDTDAEEFIEFTNISSGGDSVTLDLSGASIADGPSTPFVFPNGTQILPGERLVVVKDADAFQARYPGVSASKIAGQFTGSLSNGGERLRVTDVGSNTVFDITYGDSNEWSLAADGAGASLVLIDPANTPFDRLGKYYSWRSSEEFGGSPAAASSPVVDADRIVINEILAHTDLPQVDAIELYNPTDSEVSISGWFLSDAGDALTKYEIPVNTVLSPGQYLTFDESDFNPTPTTPAASHFALDSTGDEVYLIRPDGSGGVLFVDSVDFDATSNGESLGRVQDGGLLLAPQVANTLGGPNSVPRIAEVVISEINYHPASPTVAAQNAFQAIAGAGNLLVDSDLEFIELNNLATAEVGLANWRLRGESDFDFDAQMTVAPGDTLLVVSFDPIAEPAKLAGFLAHYNLNEGSVAVVGGYDQRLSNSFGRVELEKPDDSDPLNITHVTADEVLYDDLVPWPISLDGTPATSLVDGGGASLERVGPRMYGNAAASWLAATPSPGSVNFTPMLTGDYDRNGIVDRDDYKVWRSSYGSQLAINADGNNDGVVNAADYTVWRDNEGVPLPAAAISLPHALTQPVSTLDLADVQAEATPQLPFIYSTGATAVKAMKSDSTPVELETKQLALLLAFESDSREPEEEMINSFSDDAEDYERLSDLDELYEFLGGEVRSTTLR